MKIAFMTDTHLLPSISTRSDDYAAAVLTKMQHVANYAIDDGADIIIHGGDIFDRATVPRWLEHEVLRIIDESPVRWGIVVGTHDMGTGIPTTAGKSIHSLQSQRNVYAFSGPDTKRIGDLLLCGSCATDIWNTGAKVIVVHQMLTDVPVMWDHHLIDGIETDADYVLSGDYHPGWGWLKPRDTMFVNPGALARTFRSPHDLTRSPRFAMIDTDRGNVEIVPVPYAKDVYLEKSEPIAESLRASVSEAIESAKKKLGTDDEFDLEGLELETPVPLEDGVKRLKELCKEVEKEDD